MKVGAPPFSSGTVSAVVLFTYLLCLFLVFLNDVLPDVPMDQQGLSLQDAYLDLRYVSARLLPYNSHANDYVRSYILAKVRAIADEYPHIRLIDDPRSNGSWVSAAYGVYFEGMNILVNIERDQRGVLFSAHYDSVSTAPGTTDDGMDVVTLPQLIKYYGKNRVERTATFNINNGEEDWLNDAQAFLQHPWSRIPGTFLNPEGAASGGRPTLFRATSSAVLYAFKTRNVPHPHANVLSADAFKRGVIRSGTDYSVYTEGTQMQVFASRPVLFPLNTLYIFNILFLILGPTLLAGLFFIQAVINASTRRHEENHYHRNRPSVFTRIFTDFRLMWRWAKFWDAIFVTVGVRALLIFIFIKANPYVIYSSPYIDLFCLTTISFLTLTLWLACSPGSLETLFEVKNIPKGFSRLSSHSRSRSHSRVRSRSSSSTSGRRARCSRERTERSPLNRHHENADGNSKVGGRSSSLRPYLGNYASASLIAFLFILPLAPFSFRIHRSIGWMLLFFFVIFGLWALFWTFPFDPETPLKVYFQQSVQVDGAVTNVVTSLYGVPEYLKTDIVSKLPSAQGAQVDCLKSHVKEGLTECSWKMPSPGHAAGESDNKFTFTPTNLTTITQPTFFIPSISRTSPASAQFTLKPHNTRNCRLYFTNRPILRYTIRNSVPMMMQHHYPVSPEGIEELRLWSREWDKTFAVNVEWRDWLGLGEGLKGRVVCEWAEYASASAGVLGEGVSDSDNEGARRGEGGRWRSAKIPSVEEVLSFLPTWVVVSKFADGLVEVWEEFDV
ncbi:hypothetical protein AN958_08458 [Leucoagaricus sp. SymC.cos]|nr:hypothetical protein AN958_08458 [Leucoagaricus sp. SymC.cos]